MTDQSDGPVGGPAGGPDDGSSDGPFDEEFDTDPSLASAVMEIESHVATDGWDQPGRLFALVDTGAFLATEPELAAQVGLTEDAALGGLTPVEQPVPEETEIEDVIASIGWPEEVSGCAAVLERLVLPSTADADIPEDATAAAEYVGSHPDRQEVRIVAGVTRGGATFCAVRMREHDEEQSVMVGPDVVPELVRLLATTFHDEYDEQDEADHQDGEQP